MDRRKLGTLEVSVVGLGCNNFGWRIDADATERVVHAALDAGINFFDTADSYGPELSEQYLARAIKGRRTQCVIATKFGSKVDEQRRGAKPAYVRQALEDSLRRLEIEYIDLYQLHRPDPETPIADTLAVLDEAVRAGKVREIGCSNFSAEQLREAEAAVRQGAARFVSLQNEYSVLNREPEHGVLQECERLHLAFLPYFPLASGLLTGKYQRGALPPKGTRLGDGFLDRFATENNFAVVEQLTQFAESRGHTVLELAFSWLLMRPAVASVIAGATSPEQIRANASAATWRMTGDELAEVDRITSQIE